MDAPSRVIPVRKGAVMPYVIGATASGPSWTIPRERALGWPSERAATRWFDERWPELRAALARAGTPIIFEKVALEAKPQTDTRPTTTRPPPAVTRLPRTRTALADLRSAGEAGALTVEIAVVGLRALCLQHARLLSGDELAYVNKVCAMAPEYPPVRGFQVLAAVADTFTTAPHAFREALAEYQHLVAAAIDALRKAGVR